MYFVYEALVEWIRCIDVDAVGSHDVVVFEAYAADAGLPGIWLEIECHAFLEDHWRILRGRAEVGRLPGIHSGAVAQTVEDIRVGRSENVGVGRAGAHFATGIEERVVALLVQVTHLRCGLNVAADPRASQVAPVAVIASANVHDDQVPIANDPVGREAAVGSGVRARTNDI